MFTKSNEISTEIENEDTGSQEDESESTKSLSPVKTPGRSSRSQASPKVTPTRGSPKVLLSPGSQKITTTTPTTPVKSSVVEGAMSPIPDEEKTVETEEAKAVDESTVISTPTTTADKTVDEKLTETETIEPTVSKDAQEPVESSTPSEQITSTEQINETEEKAVEPIVSEVTSETPVDTDKPIIKEQDKHEEEEKKEEQQQQVDEKEQEKEEENKQDQEENKDKKLEEELPVKVDEPCQNEPEEVKVSTTSEENIPEINENSNVDDDNNKQDVNDNDNGDGDEKMETNELNEENLNDEIINKNDNISQIKEDSTTDVKIEPDSSNIDVKLNNEDDNKLTDVKNENNKDEINDIEMKTDIKSDEQIKDEKDTDKDTKDYDRKDRKDRKRKRSSSSQDERQKSPQPSTLRSEDEPEIDNSRVLLSWYDSDLNLVIDKTKFLSATPMHNDGFSYVWAGARASYGFTSGKLYYEVKITHECNVSLQDEQDPHVLRAGWSLLNSSMQLGEDKYTYGYGGTGKISTNLEFKDYGPKFGLNDILTCFIDFTDNDKIVMSYKLNGKHLGDAFTILKSDVDNKPFYPHILTKNCGFVCNFGDEKSWTDDIPDDYIPVSQVDIKERFAGPQRPDKREDCQVLMLIGLPASGKTVWANKYAQENSDKLYNVLGTNNLIDKMRVSGLARKKAYNTRWDTLYTKCNKCLTTLLDVASHRRRNYILDQTNVYPSAQRRKMRHFYGFQRKAIVIVPTDEEFKSRTAKREADEGKDVPDNNILEMKANFEAPNVGESFDAVEWIELNEEEGKKLISKYNKEGKDAGYGQQQSSKRSRFDKTNDSHRDNRDVRSSRDSRDSRDHRDRRNAYSDRNRNSTWRGGNQIGMRHSNSGYGSSSGGWSDRRPSNSSYRGGGGGGGYGSSSSGYRGRGGSSNTPYRNNDRRGPSSDRRTSGNDRRVSSSRQGGWGPMNSNYNNSNSSNWGNSSHGSGWSGNSSSSSSSSTTQQSNWSSGQSGNWSGSTNSNSGGQGGNWGGSWKGYGSNSNYNQSSYGSGQQQQQTYGNGGNWGSWNNPSQQQYYGQYWGQSQGQTSTSGQTTTGSSSTPAASSGTTTSSYNNYPANWGSYSGSYNYSTDSTNPSTQK
ncbi:heterogeneous nuclear ribonucleoprotein U-like protein 1 isoform X2 [Aphidius gifuensis]|uniref:heterogeneous nuclear ribonucleoprotein U-like protein 1 isoform X2 n=1 Tax=Aphidius gifuensis TaxID=684658 RepID=UPI001CDBD66E|nr:heterogeneous nuclear ribonucleoprotein U-like protein 1 isoform X2 [Aphidius gifuensis]